MADSLHPLRAVNTSELQAGPAGLRGALTALIDGRDAIGAALFEPPVCARYARVAANAPYRRAEPVVGPERRRVWQRFETFTAVPSELQALAQRVEALVNESRRLLDPPPCPALAFNELTLQRYPTGGYGITPHRDHRRYRYLAAVVVIAGRGRFLVCDDRAGRNACEIPAPAGTLVLMRAPGFAGTDRRPFHVVLDVAGPRITLGLRYNSELNAAP